MTLKYLKTPLLVSSLVLLAAGLAAALRTEAHAGEALVALCVGSAIGFAFGERRS